MSTMSKGEITRQRLIDAAFSLFATRDFDTVTIEEIVAAAGVSRRTFFRHFPTKEEIVFPFNYERLDMFRSMIRAQTGGRRATFEDIKTVFKEMVKNWIARKEKMILSRRIVASSPSLLMYDQSINAKWELAIALELDGAGDGLDGIDPTPSFLAQSIAGMIVGAIRPAFENWFESDGETDLTTLGLEALDLVEHGLAKYMERNPYTD